MPDIKITSYTKEYDTLGMVYYYVTLPIRLVSNRYFIIIMLIPVAYLVINFPVDFVGFILFSIYMVYLACVMAMPFYLSRHKDLYPTFQDFVCSTRKMIYGLSDCVITTHDIKKDIAKYEMLIENNEYRLYLDLNPAFVDFEFEGDFRQYLKTYGVKSNSTNDEDPYIYLTFTKEPIEGYAKVVYC